MTTTTIDTIDTIAPTLLASDLVTGLNAVIPHAGKDVPPLNAVRFEACEMTLTLVASDRYTLGTYRIPWPSGPSAVGFTLELAEAKRLLGFAKANRLDPLTFTLDGALEVAGYSSSIRVPVSDNTYPKWRNLLDGTDVPSEDPLPMFNLNPVFMARFAKATVGKNPVMRISVPAKVSKVRVDIGEQFTGLIMCVRDVS